MLEWLLFAAAVLATAPVRLSVRADLNIAPTFQIVVTVYGVRQAFEGALSERGRIALRREGGKEEFQAPVRVLSYFFFQLYRSAVKPRAEVLCRVGADDAMATALAAAGLSALLKAVCAPLNARVDVRPEFSRPFFALKARCILCFRAGDIMVAVARTLAGGRAKNRKAGTAHGSASN